MTPIEHIPEPIIRIFLRDYSILIFKLNLNFILKIVIYQCRRSSGVSRSDNRIWYSSGMHLCISLKSRE